MKQKTLHVDAHFFTHEGREREHQEKNFIREKGMDEDKRKQRKTRRYVYMIAGAYISWQGISIGIDMKNNVAADRPEMIAISAVLLILTGLALIVWQLRKLKKEQKEEASEDSLS